MAAGAYRGTRHHPPEKRIDVREQSERTTNVVREVKQLLDAQTRRGTRIGPVEVERSTFNAKHSLDERNFDLFQWEQRMPDECRPVNREALLLSMAYANEIDDVSRIYRAKSRGDSADLSDALGALKKAKRDAEGGSKLKLCPMLRSMDKNEVHRANRLFYSEVLHLLPHLERFKMTDAEYVVRAIQDTNYALREPDELLPLLTSCDAYEDAVRGIQNMEEKSRRKSDDPSSLRKSPVNSGDNDRAESGIREPQQDNFNSRRGYDSPTTRR